MKMRGLDVLLIVNHWSFLMSWQQFKMNEVLNWLRKAKEM